ncbi:IPT/TIG domain-containing protein [Spirosoma sp. SC4-14]|uniref:IPT/TIG domain-containing protein n=1 Tax=Spirosoma sp. SC4-14 TaxID=3128900 RepID=UPI0030CC49FE
MKSVFILFSFLFFVFGISACRVRNAPPELTTLHPSEAYVGQEITLGGYQFGDEPVVTFGRSGSAVAGQVVSGADQSIRVIVPILSPGLTQVQVQTSEGISDPLPIKILQPPPVVSAVSPENGLPGTTFVITGNYLNQIEELRLDQTEAIIKDSSATKLTLQVPQNMPHGPINIVIGTKGGVTNASFIVAGTPQIASISPKVGKPGSELVIQGVNLTDGLVQINGLTTDRNQTIVKDNEIRTPIPMNATSGLVTVTVFEKLVATSTDSLKIVLPPAVANLSARDGIAGDKIILTGLNLKDVTGVMFGSTPVSYRILNDTQIEATVPTLMASGSLAVSVTSAGGTATATDQFFFYLAPSNLVLTPTRQLPLQQISITGQNLYRITEVKVSGQVVSIISRIEGSQLQIGVPADAVSGPITVTNRAGTATSQPLVVIQAPVITAIVPAKARPGERVVVQGNYLYNAQFYFTGSTPPAADGGKNDDTERWILVPSDAQTGPIRVINATNVSVNTDVFTVVRLAAITDFTPKTAKVGDEITITGQNLSSVTAVKFNGGTLPTTFRLSGSSLIVAVPTGAITGQICLTTEAGSTCTSANFSPAQ